MTKKILELSQAFLLVVFGISLLIGVAGIAVLNWPAIIAGNLNDLKGLF